MLCWMGLFARLDLDLLAYTPDLGLIRLTRVSRIQQLASRVLVQQRRSSPNLIAVGCIEG